MIHDEDDHRGLPIHSPRALQLLDACEPTGRTVYGGVVGYFDLSGQMDAAIATRTAVLPGGKAYVQSGGGVAVDSDAERQETVNKAPAAAPALSRLGVEGQDYTTGFGLWAGLAGSLTLIAGALGTLLFSPSWEDEAEGGASR